MVSAVGSIIGGAISANGAKSAAKTQAAAANNATDLQGHMFDEIRDSLKPYMNSGESANKALLEYMGLNEGGNPLTSPLLKPISIDQATLEQTPGYQFNLSQGLKATQNSAAARGLGVSGAALKGAANYATGLADSTYQNQFNNAVTNQTNQYNRLTGLANAGQNAAANLGVQGTQTAANIGNNITGAGNAVGASQIAGANAFGAGIQSAANQLSAGMYGNSYNPEAAMNGLPWSDARLKENIVHIGYENGWPLYEFSYLWSPLRHIGVMAQDIIKKMPDAVHLIGNYMTVDYHKIGVIPRSAI